jgi:hypothetical protein
MRAMKMPTMQQQQQQNRDKVRPAIDEKKR